MRYLAPLALALASCGQTATEQAQPKADPQERTTADRLADAASRAMCADSPQGRTEAIADVAEAAQGYGEGNAADDALDAALAGCPQL